jgi:cytochrome c oxidase cbb3-type subunit I/II
VSFYMMSTFEGPLLSIKAVNALSHNTDWTIAHVHSGALGWNGFLTFGMLYWLLPRLYGTKLHSVKLANVHFWTGTVGILLYIVSMYVAGAMHGVMARQLDATGALAHTNFMEIVTAILPLQGIRALGGALYLVGLLVMIYNLIKTVRSAPKPVDTKGSAPRLKPWNHWSFPKWSDLVEHWGVVMTLLVTVAVAAGGVLEMVPAFTADTRSFDLEQVKPYTPLEVEGRDIYIREGCNNCHTQMIRSLAEESLRYGPRSLPGEFVYDTPHLWGSKRTGPDLARIGGKYGDVWHYKHMIDPRGLVPGSVMPSYAWLAENALDTTGTVGKMKALSTVGVPYLAGDFLGAKKALARQAEDIRIRLAEQGEPDARADSELVALIAYLQRMGTDLGKGKKVSDSTASKEATP